MLNTTSSVPSLSDIAAVAGNNDGFGGNNGWWILIILFAIFGGWGNGFGNNYANGQVATTSDVQRSFDNTEVNTKLNTIGNGMADLGYSIANQFAQAELSRANQQAALMAQMNSNNISDLQGFNNIAQAINNTSCATNEAISNVRFDNASNTTAITNAITLAAQQIMQNDNTNYRQLHDENIAIQMEAKNDKISELQAQVTALNLAASQCAQNATLIDALKPSANPAYIVANPYTGTYYSSCPCNS